MITYVGVAPTPAASATRESDSTAAALAWVSSAVLNLAQRRQDVQAQKIGLGREARRRALRACGVEISARELIDGEGLNETGWTRFGRSFHSGHSFGAT